MFKKHDYFTCIQAVSSIFIRFVQIYFVLLTPHPTQFNLPAWNNYRQHFRAAVTTRDIVLYSCSIRLLLHVLTVSLVLAVVFNLHRPWISKRKGEFKYLFSFNTFFVIIHLVSRVLHCSGRREMCLCQSTLDKYHPISILLMLY